MRLTTYLRRRQKPKTEGQETQNLHMHYHSSGIQILNSYTYFFYLPQNEPKQALLFFIALYQLLHHFRRIPFLLSHSPLSCPFKTAPFLIIAFICCPSPAKVRFASLRWATFSFFCLFFTFNSSCFSLFYFSSNPFGVTAEALLSISTAFTIKQTCQHATSRTWSPL